MLDKLTCSIEVSTIYHILVTKDFLYAIFLFFLLVNVIILDEVFHAFHTMCTIMYKPSQDNSIMHMSGMLDVNGNLWI